MAANSIGNASLRLSASGGELASGLAKAGQGIKQWGDKTQAAVAGTVTAVAGKVVGGLSNAKALLSGAGAAIGTYLGGPIGTAIGGAVGSAAGGIVESIFGAITEPLERLNVFGGLTKQADALGIKSSQFAGLTQQLARVGVEGDAANAVFAKLGKKVSDATHGNAEASASFARLGINAQELSKLPLDEQFKRVADAVALLPPGGEQAAAAMKLFEEAGTKLLPVLQKGGAGIQDFIEQQKKTGAVLSDSQYKAAADAAKAWKDSKNAITSVWDGLVNRATLIAAPIVKFLGGVVQKAFSLLTPVFDWLGRAIEKASVILEAVFQVLSIWIDEAVKWISELVTSVFDFGNSWPSIEDVVFSVLKGLTQAIGYVWDTLRAGAGAMAYIVSFLVEGFGHVVEAFKGTIKDLLDLAGELPDQLGGKMFRDSAKNVDQWGNKIKDAGKQMREWGKGQIGGFGDSANKIGTWFDRIKDKTRDAVKQGEKAQEQAAQLQPYKGVDAAIKGTKEAYSIESKFRWESSLNKKVDEKQLEVMKQVKQACEGILQKIGNSIPLLAG